MNFQKKVGGHSKPKNFVADFSTFQKKAQHCFPKGGVVQRPFGSFLKISSNLLDQVIPKQGLRVRNLDIPRVTKNKISTCNNSAGIYSLKTNQWSLTIGQ